MKEGKPRKDAGLLPKGDSKRKGANSAHPSKGKAREKAQKLTLLSKVTARNIANGVARLTCL